MNVHISSFSEQNRGIFVPFPKVIMAWTSWMLLVDWTRANVMVRRWWAENRVECVQRWWRGREEEESGEKTLKVGQKWFYNGTTLMFSVYLGLSGLEFSPWFINWTVCSSEYVRSWTHTLPFCYWHRCCNKTNLPTSNLTTWSAEFTSEYTNRRERRTRRRSWTTIRSV